MKINLKRAHAIIREIDHKIWEIRAKLRFYKFVSKSDVGIDVDKLDANLELDWDTCKILLNIREEMKLDLHQQNQNENVLLMLTKASALYYKIEILEPIAHDMAAHRENGINVKHFNEVSLPEGVDTVRVNFSPVYDDEETEKLVHTYKQERRNILNDIERINHTNYIDVCVSNIDVLEGLGIFI